jgi:polar amino acid transport system permease protein
MLVILPQAMPVIIPPYVSLVTSLVQASSLGAVIGVEEVFRAGQVIIEQTTLTRGGSPAYIVYGFLLVIYFVLCWLISLVGRRCEQHFTRHLTGADAASALPRGTTQVVPA